MPQEQHLTQTRPRNGGLPRRACLCWPDTRTCSRCCLGPFAPPVLGNLPAIARMDLIGFIDHCRHKYGSIFKVWIWVSGCSS